MILWGTRGNRLVGGGCLRACACFRGGHQKEVFGGSLWCEEPKDHRKHQRLRLPSLYSEDTFSPSANWTQLKQPGNVCQFRLCWDVSCFCSSSLRNWDSRHKSLWPPKPKLWNNVLLAPWLCPRDGPLRICMATHWLPWLQESFSTFRVKQFGANNSETGYCWMSPEQILQIMLALPSRFLEIMKTHFSAPPSPKIEILLWSKSCVCALWQARQWTPTSCAPGPAWLPLVLNAKSIVSAGAIHHCQTSKRGKSIKAKPKTPTRLGFNYFSTKGSSLVRC